MLGKKVRRLRREGFLPAVLYGQQQKAHALTIERKAFETLWRQSGESTLVRLEVAPARRGGADDGAKATEDAQTTEDATARRGGADDGAPATEDVPAASETVLIHDVAVDPLTNAPQHVDFYRVDLAEPIRLKVPLVFTGEAPAVSELEGVLVKNVHEVEIEALPDRLPKELRVDIAALRTFDDHLLVSQILLPEGVRLLDTLDLIVATVKPPRSAEELAELEAKPVEAVAEIELSEKRGKEEGAAESAPEEGARPTS